MEVLSRSRMLSHGDMLGCYRVESVLGKGGFGVTYLALDTNLDLRVAIKEYLPEQIATRDSDSSVRPISENEEEAFRWGLDRFIKEARTLAKFKHLNIVRVMTVFEQNHTAYMVMEFERGQDLKQLFDQNDHKSEAFLKRIIGPIIDGLAEVHRHGYIHRDIKPANIHIREDGTPVLLDFGSARQAMGSRTQALTALVSVGYAPLEQYNDSSDDQQGPWTDIYALGAVLYYAISGNAPVDSTLRGSAVLNDRADPLLPCAAVGQGSYSEDFCRAIDWALSFKVADRPQSLEQWRNRLLSEDNTVLMPRNRTAQPVHTSAHHPGSQQSAPRAGPESHLADFETDIDFDRPLPVPEHLRAESDWETGDAALLPAAEPRSYRNSSRRPQSTRGPVTPTKRSRPGVLWGGIAVLLVLVAGTVFYFFSQSNMTADSEEIQAAEAKREADRLTEQRTVEQAQARRFQEQELARRQQAAQEALRAEESARRADEEKAILAERARQQAALAEAEQQAQRERQRLDAAEAERQAVQAREKEAIAKAEQERLLNIEAERQAEAARMDAARVNAARLEAERATQERVEQQAQRLAEDAQQAEAKRLASLRNRPISDGDMQRVLANFNLLAKAIENKDTLTIASLTKPSDAQNKLFTYLFDNFDSIDVALSGISVRRTNQSIHATLKINQMVRANGDRVLPSATFRDIPINSVRYQDNWSRINW